MKKIITTSIFALLLVTATNAQNWGKKKIKGNGYWRCIKGLADIDQSHLGGLISADIGEQVLRRICLSSRTVPGNLY